MSEEEDGILSGGSFPRHQFSNSSSVSLKSDRSKDEPLNFDSEDQSFPRHQFSNSSSVSLKSDRSKDEPLNFDSKGQSLPEHQTPTSSSVSLKSDRSKDEPSSSDSEGESLPEHQTPTSSSVSLKSDRSKDEPSSSDSEGESLPEHQTPTSSSVSLKSDRSKDEPSSSDSEGESEPNDNQPETSGAADTGEDPKGSFSIKGDAKEENYLKEEILKVDQHKNNPKLSEIVTFESGKKNQVSFKDLFTNNKFHITKIFGKSNKVRTVLMEGVPGVGKTCQTKMFMNDWERGKSNEHIKALVTLDFTELNRKKDELKSMKSLLNDFFNKKEVNVSSDDKEKFCFILDGLEKCKLPLDFVKNKKVKDLNEAASMDVLLTNLIKGNLLPDAHIWIISQPKGVDKIPSKYINKTVLCHGDAMEEEYLKKVILEEVGQQESDPKLSEMFESGKKNLITPNDLFTNKKSEISTLPDMLNNVRTVLMEGIPGVGKTFQTKMFMIDWANGKSSQHIKALVTLDFTELKSKKNEVKSMKSLLNDFFNKRNAVVSIDDKKKFCFILDSLEKCKLPLDFVNNKKVKDLNEAASMDVLLTNLIKGNLLPDAHIWIISQPKGVDKIPSEYINKTVLCHGDAMEEEKYLKKVILEEVGQQESDPNFSEIVMFESGKKNLITPNDLFTNNKSEISTLPDMLNNVRTVLMEGIPGVGKTFQTKMFMKDWANGKSNEHIKALVTLDFTELKSKKNEVKSMKSLLNDFFNKRNAVVSIDDKKKFCFILDSLEKCKLPLDFVNNKKVKDLNEAASMDVLLTNLIKGNLLPDAHIWIISQPKGVNKIPSEYINKTVLCHGDAMEEEYLKKVIFEEVGQQESDPNFSEIVMFESGKKNLIKPSDLFTYNKAEISTLPDMLNNVRTVLMEGVPGVGKTFQTKMFMIDWANGKSSQHIKALVTLDFTELKSKKNEVKSMKSLLNDFFNKRNSVVSKDDKKKLCFILDSLEKCKLPLDFVNNKKVKDLNEAASMDVLLTNLIKGNLLPDAHIWIISQPKGVDKIPSDYINKTVLCHGDAMEEEYLKKVILEEVGQQESDPKLSEMFESGKKNLITPNDLFTNKKSEISTLPDMLNNVRTVLMEGIPGVGKTFQTKMFMIDWANGKSSQHIKALVTLDFTELKSKKNEVKSMKSLLNDFFNKRNAVVSIDDKKKFCFILDSLEKCKLPLDFVNNKKVKDLNEAASMDVLLTNLIKGNLLPDAHIWIISQPKGVDKIPSDYINKTVLCHGDAMEEKYLKKVILGEVVQHESDPKLSEIVTCESGKKNLITPKDPFPIKKLFSSDVRTVLMEGIPGVGKTFQTKMFMIDWAKGKSNEHIKAVVSLEFTELNTKRDEEKSMESLLNDFFNKKNAVSKDKKKICFILDGLEKCKLPLDFVKNKEVKDLNEAASMDVLLTNLIKGNLLPDAHIWIISQPKGVKIPSEYVNKTVLCQETYEQREKLETCLKNRFRKEITDEKDEISHPNQNTTEHIIKRENGSEEGESKQNKFTKVNQPSEIFKDGKGEKTRTVMTIGGAGIGKSFHMKKFIKEWAKKDNENTSFFTWFKKLLPGQAKPPELLFLIDFSELNSIKNKNMSLFELLNHFFKETKDIIISDYSQLNVVFLLDGLDAYQHGLDFENNENSIDVREPTSVNMLLTNLIRGNLLPEAKVWITSQPRAAEKIPVGIIDRLTEIREKPDITSQRNLKSELKDQFTSVSEGIDGQKTSALLNEVFTDLYIIEGDRAQNEAMQVQDANFKTTYEETSIKYCDIFKPAYSNQNIKTVLTVGVAGIGKTFASMKYILDWAESKEAENIFFILPLPFRELNLRADKDHSLNDLIHQFFPAMRTSEITDYDKYKILIVLDGFDECRLDLEFKNIDKMSDVTTPTSMKALLSNLILGNLLPEAQIWITSRPAASNNIPPENVDRMTEVRGFNDEQKEKYFMKRFSDKKVAEKILSYVKKSRILYIMCHIPVFCFITSKVLEDFVERNQDYGLPQTLTDMYTHFLLLQRRQTKVKYNTDQSTSETSGTETFCDKTNDETILSLGKLAFKGLEEKNLLFSEEDLTSCGTDVTKAAVFSGLFTQIKRENHELYPQNMFCFVHQSIQEYMAALHVFYSFNNKGEIVFTEPSSTASDPTASEFYKKAVDKAFASEHGDWDMFLRFLMGLSLESNQDLLQDLIDKTKKHKDTSKKAAVYIKKKIRENNSDPEKNLNLFYCLNELNDDTLVKEIKKYLNSEEKPFETFSASQWSALTFVLLTSDENLEVFDLKKYLKSEKVLLGLMPLVKVSKTTLLSWCELSEESCNGLTSSVLTKPSSNLTELDMSHNDLLDAGVIRLAEGLKHVNCKLETLKLSWCELSEESCNGLTSVLTKPSSNLTELDLSHNDLLDAGVIRLAEGLKHVNCKLETLKLAGCQVTEKGCISLAEAIQSHINSSLKHLDLSYNHPGDNGMRALNAIVEDPTRTLETVNFDCKGEHRLKPGWSKYGADLKFDKNSASRRLVLAENNKKAVTDNDVKKLEMRNTSDERFRRTQVFCDEGLQRLCYWEVEWEGVVGIAVAYKDVGRSWNRDGGLGCNDKSWSLLCSESGYTAMHKDIKEEIEVPICKKIHVFLDWEGGTLSYYNITSEKRSLIHTFKSNFTAELFPAFWFKKGSVTLCDL